MVTTVLQFRHPDMSSRRRDGSTFNADPRHRLLLAWRIYIRPGSFNHPRSSFERSLECPEFCVRPLQSCNSSSRRSVLGDSRFMRRSPPCNIGSRAGPFGLAAPAASIRPRADRWLRPFSELQWRRRHGTISPTASLSAASVAIWLERPQPARPAGNFTALPYDSTQLVQHQDAGGMPVTFFAGFEPRNSAMASAARLLR